MKKLLFSKNGFTMVEMVIVITILAILASMGIYNYGGEVARSKAASDLYNARQISTAINRAYVDGQLKLANGSIDTSLFSDTNILRLSETSGIGQKIYTLNYVTEPGTFKVKGKEKQNWVFGYTLTMKGVLNVYVCDPALIGSAFNTSSAVMLYPSVTSTTTIHPYDMVINK